MTTVIFHFKKNSITFLTVLILAGFAAALGISGVFSSSEKMEQFLNQAGILAPAAFILLQIIQVIFPILPGGVSCLLGVAVFGPLSGFIYSYTGLVLGSVISFLLIRKYGQALIQKLVSEKNYTKYAGWLQKGKKFNLLFAAAIFLPGFPDDLLCMLAGLSSMSFKKFFIIILLCRPVSLIGYSAGFSAVTALL
ncbi:MAG: TVP38/TMEM64 family protein [Clostridiales bacterium]|nr:TVP38/TMEM64 family protein [Clostridiales bacterium]